tara:strand:- start:65977 stop:67332 length:1356 start_codon:yes stop_codon:yes gene_type:complete
MSKFESSLLNQHFKKCKEAYPELDTERVVVGVSGGPDSMSLLYLLHRNSVNTIVVHCNYQLRDKSSDLDQALVEDVCTLWGLECVSVRLESDTANAGNFQDWARNERYRIFQDIQNEYKAAYILTAHHEDDQIETIFQKILRGAGLTSWKGMRLLEGVLMRPLLEVSRSDIMSFVQEFNIPYRIDGSNEESTYARNFIRNQWFPEVNRLFPGWKSNMLQLPERAEEYREMSDMILTQLLDRPGHLNREKFLSLKERLKPVLMHRFIQISRHPVEVSTGFLSNLEGLKNLQTGKRIQITESIFLLRERDHFILYKESESKESDVVIEDQDLDNGLSLFGFDWYIDNEFSSLDRSKIQLDYQELLFPLTVRYWKAGDQIQPLGMKGRQNVSDLLTNYKVSAKSKKQAKVVESFDGTVYAVIFPDGFKNGQFGVISEKVRCSEETFKTLTIAII